MLWCYDPVTRHFYHSLDVTYLKTVPFYTGSFPLMEATIETAKEDDSVLPRPVLIFESPTVSLPLVPCYCSLTVYSRRPCSSDPRQLLLWNQVSLLFLLFLKLLLSVILLVYVAFLHASFFLVVLTILISKYVSYQGLSNSYRSFVSAIDSVSIP